MGGLASALAFAKSGFVNIDVYEAASGLGFVGAGIQLAPNMNRILDRLGVWESIKKEAVGVEETSIRREHDFSIVDFGFQKLLVLIESLLHSGVTKRASISLSNSCYAHLYMC
jgi:2-polyprenyl-6-methoxyphenol hydroxylase-like FAD-dependent oxidoreductase